MRYIVHLLPDGAQCRAFDDLRARVAAAIGSNRALDYPTAHVTLVWAMQDAPGDPAPIDQAALCAVLNGFRQSGVISLPVRPPIDTREHLLLPLENTPALAELRHALYVAVRDVVAGSDGARRERAERVREQTWPHLTIAQEITPEHWERGMAILAAEGDWLREPIVGAELALVARDVDRGEPYAITHRVPLVP
ncbi:MAG: hypothetical protein U0841_30180 [Chloroflexia bacterium]